MCKRAKLLVPVSDDDFELELLCDADWEEQLRAIEAEIDAEADSVPRGWDYV